jgi:hemerythrin-like domain-containing protein
LDASYACRDVGQLQGQIDLYADAHKGQRLRFSMISKAAGTLEINNQESLTSLENEIISFREHMFLHASHEEKFVHPMLSEKVPGGANKLNGDHRIMHQQFDEIVACLEELKKKPTDFEKLQDLAQEFYLAWSRFTSFYLSHIDYEEEYAMPTLRKLCTYDELSGARGKILGSQEPKSMMYSLEMILPALSPTERFLVLSQGLKTAPPEAFQSAIRIAEHVLSPEDWLSLKKMLKLG